MQDFSQIQDNLAYLLYLISSPQWLVVVLDLLLVTVSFFLILIVIRRSRAAILLRGGVLLALLLMAVWALLPLPTFDWLLLGVLVVGLVATPMIFQPELRRGLERLGRTFGFLNVRPTELVHRVVPALVRATTDLADRRTGALMVLEGESELGDVISTGVSLKAQFSSDLLETIFFDKTPLHDGAVVVRDDVVEAAACVLPLSEQTLPAGLHQGTRHRAALGISEQSDCLVVVVSEETGRISVAHQGRLFFGIDPTELRERLYRFYDPRQQASNGSRASAGRLLSLPLGLRVRRPARLQLRSTLDFLMTLLLAAIMSMGAWLLVVDQVNPPQEVTISGVELRPLNLAKDMVIVTNVPKTVNVTVQSPQDLVDNLQPAAFRASIDLAGLPVDLNAVPVQVARPGDARVRVLRTDPPNISVELQPLDSRPISVTVVIQDRDSLPFSYELDGLPMADPSQVTVSGAANILGELTRAEATVALQGSRRTVQEERPLTLKDSAGNRLSGLVTDPETVQVTVSIRQAFNTRDVTVHAIITGTVAGGYWIPNITVDPQTVTLLGDPEQLDVVGSFVDTVPVDVAGAAGDVIRRVPLAPPSGVSALNERGVTEGSVEVRVFVVPRMGNLRLTLPVEVAGAATGTTVSRSPATVDVLLSGPLPVLNQVNADQRLVRVLVDVGELGPGVHDVTPTLIVPETLSATVVPAAIQVRLEVPTPTLVPGPTGTPVAPAAPSLSP